MSQPESILPPAGEGGKTHFRGVSYYDSRWQVATAVGALPISDMVGLVVNIGDKDGGVYEGVTVVAADERTGELTVSGGGFGQRFRDTEARPFEGTRKIWPHDIARGYVHLARSAHEYDPS